jgi:hypothetical protein
LGGRGKTNFDARIKIKYYILKKWYEDFLAMIGDCRCAPFSKLYN